MRSGIGRCLAACSVVPLLLASGCAAWVREQHFFASYAPAENGEDARLVNIFMLDVEASSQFSDMRYLAGNYDEAAVDYFLNESKSEDYPVSANGQSQSANSFRGIWNLSCPTDSNVDACKKKWDEARSVMPVRGENGGNPGDAFVIIMSTNANAISETIGAIAENATTMKSLSYLMNKETFDARAKLHVTRDQKATHRTLFLGALDAQMTDYAADPANSANRELAVLKMLAAELDPAGPAAFNDLQGARTWFATIK
jgi:hypothetical protein